MVPWNSQPSAPGRALPLTTFSWPSSCHDYQILQPEMPGPILLDEAIRGAMDLYLERLQQAIASATRGMTGEDLTRHPDGHPEGTWSVAEVREHLYLTYAGTTKAFERCLQAGKPAGHSHHPEAAG